MTAEQLLQENLKHWMRERRKTAADLSRETDLSESFLSDVLKGKKGAGLDTVDVLARALNLPVSTLFVDRDEPRRALAEGGRPAIKGAPDDPQAREAYLLETVTTLNDIAQALFRISAGEPAPQAQTSPSPQPASPRRPRTTRVRPTRKSGKKETYR